MKKRNVRVVYWISTAILCIPMGVGGVLDIVAPPDVANMMTHLGYPAYFAKMLGVAKLLGLATILLNRPNRMKEWAYAGMSFDVIAASISHLAVGDELAKIVVPLVFLGVLFTSYSCWHKLSAERPQHAKAEI